jgi:hypothetical protein
MSATNRAMYRFGKHPPKHDYRTLRFKDYLTSKLPAPAAEYNVLTRVYDNLGTSQAATLFPMDGNDTLGDCTIAALAHATTVYSGLVNKKNILPKQAVVKLYMSLTGGIDSGMNELDVLNYWRKNSVAGDQVLAYVSLDPKNHIHVQQAASLFGGVYIGFQVQANCLQEFEARQPWQAGPLTTDGHAVYTVAYNAAGVTVLTWGNTQQGTWAWWDECVDEAYAIVPSDAKDPKFAPGFDVQQLLTDLNDVAN